jgi:hypothetical protein
MKIAQMEGFNDSYATNSTYLIPFDTLFFNVFMCLQLSSSIYVGRNDYDYWQYFALRTLPFVSAIISLLFIYGVERLYSPYWIDSIIVSLLAIQTIHFSVYDWS